MLRARSIAPLPALRKQCSIELDPGRLHQREVDVDLLLDQRIEFRRLQRQWLDPLRRELVLYGGQLQRLLRLLVQAVHDRRSEERRVGKGGGSEVVSCAYTG